MSYLQISLMKNLLSRMFHKSYILTILGYDNLYCRFLRDLKNLFFI